MYSLPTNPKINYCNYFNYSVKLTEEGDTFSARCSYIPLNDIVENITISLLKGDKEYFVSDFKTTKNSNYVKSKSASEIFISLTDGPADLVEATVKIAVNKDGLIIASDDEKPEYTLKIKGDLVFGKVEDLAAVRFEGCDGIIRSTLGPAVSNLDNGIFNRANDTALKLGSDNSVKLGFDFKKICIVLPPLVT